MSILADNLGILLNGLSYGMILVMAALGLSLIFGLMGVLNFAHGSLFMLGAYTGLSVMKLSGGGLSGYVLALVLAPVVVALVGAGLERTVFRPLYDVDPIYQLLLTFGLAVVLEEVVKVIWGVNPPTLPARPAVFGGAIDVGSIHLAYYKLFLVGLGVALVALTVAFLRYTKYGLIIRAGVYDDDKTRMLGLDVNRAFTLVFGIGSAIAAVGGVAYIYRTGLNTNIGANIILPAFIVVIVGGLGSLRGTVLAGLLIGVVWQFTTFYLPLFSGTISFLILIGVLLARPQGLLGDPEVEV